MATDEFQCSECPRMLKSKQGYGKHLRWHERMNLDGERVTRSSRNESATKRQTVKMLNAYLNKLARPKSPAGRVRLSIDELNKRINEAWDAEDRLRAVELTALRHRKEAEEPEKLEQFFIDNAGAYSNEKGITAAVWREFGVPAAILREAGIK